MYVLFSNNIRSQYGTNHWIPFTEQEVEASEKFESNFMAKYIQGKVDTKITFDLFQKVVQEEQKPLQFSATATAVFNAGRQLWKYYHQSIKDIPTWTGLERNVNASLYDIRMYFQGKNDKGKMNSKSEDETYMHLLADLREALHRLAQKIAPKVYDYGFLRR